MTKVEEIRQAIDKLTPRERVELNALLHEPQAGAETLHVSHAAADFLATEARAELESGVAQIHESPAAFAASTRAGGCGIVRP